MLTVRGICTVVRSCTVKMEQELNEQANKLSSNPFFYRTTRTTIQKLVPVWILDKLLIASNRTRFGQIEQISNGQ